MASASENRPERRGTQVAGGWAGAGTRSLQTGRRGVPWWVSIVLIALTCLGLVASTLTIWVEATVLNTDGFMALVAPLGRDPQVIDSVSGYVADQAVATLDISGRTASVLPVGGQFLVGPLEQGVHDFVQTHTADFLSSERGQTTWQVVARSLHTELVAALRGEPSTVTIANGGLTVDLLPLVAGSLRELQAADPALIPSRLPIPGLSGAQSPGQEREALARALGASLPPDFGVVTVVRSDTLATAQRVVTTLDTLRFALPIVTLALAAAAIWSAADRRRALLLLGIGMAVSALAALLLAQVLLGQTAASVTASPAHEIAEALVEPMQASLTGSLLGVALAGALLALGAYLAGKPQWMARRSENARVL